MKTTTAPVVAPSLPSTQVIASTSRHAQHAAVSLDERLVRVLENLETRLALLGHGEAHVSAVPTKLMTADDLATILNADVRTVRRWVREGEVPAPIRIGGTLRWRRADIDRWLEKLQ